MIVETLKNGTALARFERMLINQQVMPNVARELCHGDIHRILPAATFSSPLVTTSAGTSPFIHPIVVTKLFRCQSITRIRL